MKILIVDDDPKLARVVADALSEEGYTAHTCATGPDALAHAQSDAYNLLLLDWMLPGIDGLEVCRQLRRAGSTIPIMMLTGRGELAERMLGLTAGADDYLIKPFELDELVARVHALLRRSARNHHLKFGPLELNRDSRQAILNGQILNLNPREFSLLLHLAYRCNQIITRKELFSLVWSSRFDPDCSNVLAVHMCHLRAKLGEYAWMLDTVHGLGYRLRTQKDPC